MRPNPVLLLCFTLSLLGASAARADAAVFLSSEPRAPELGSALGLSLRGHGVLLAVRLMADARTPLERAAAAQRIARNLGVQAAVWIENEPPLRVRALRASANSVVEAPLPAPPATISSAVFASVAESLVLEVLGLTAPRAGASPEARGEAAPVSPPPWSSTREVRRGLGSAALARFFLRTSFVYGLVAVHDGLPSDRAPPSELANAAVFSERPEEVFAAEGYDCRIERLPEGGLLADNCGVDVARSGMVGVPALDLAAGFHASSRLSFALTARVAMRAGLGTFAPALLGAQAEVMLFRPRPQGPWLSLASGFGLGRIQVQTPGGAGRSDYPFITSGLANWRVGALFGYRLHPNAGVHGGVLLHLMWPDRLFAIDPGIGFEVRL